MQESSEQRGKSERVDAIAHALRIHFHLLTGILFFTGLTVLLLGAAEQSDPNSVARDIFQR